MSGDYPTYRADGCWTMDGGLTWTTGMTYRPYQAPYEFVPPPLGAWDVVTQADVNAFVGTLRRRGTPWDDGCARLIEKLWAARSAEGANVTSNKPAHDVTTIKGSK